MVRKHRDIEGIEGSSNGEQLAISHLRFIEEDCSQFYTAPANSYYLNTSTCQILRRATDYPRCFRLPDHRGQPCAISITEFIGTFFLVFTICLTVTGESPHGTARDRLLADDHGVHGRPYLRRRTTTRPVSLALLLRGKMPGKDFIPYVVAQVLGAIVAAYLSSVIFGRTIPDRTLGERKRAWRRSWSRFSSPSRWRSSCSTSLTHPDVKGNSFYGLGHWIYHRGRRVCRRRHFRWRVQSRRGNRHQPWFTRCSAEGPFASWWLYLVGPFVGGALAAVVYKIQEVPST